MPDALRLATLAVATVALFGTATAGHAQEPIRIGVLQPMTGPATKNGTENFTAMQIAREMINERGGINGRIRPGAIRCPDCAQSGQKAATAHRCAAA